jgi:hypothetical protein
VPPRWQLHVRVLAGVTLFPLTLALGDMHVQPVANTTCMTCRRRGASSSGCCGRNDEVPHAWTRYHGRARTPHGWSRWRRRRRRRHYAAMAAARRGPTSLMVVPRGLLTPPGHGCVRALVGTGWGMAMECGVEGRTRPRPLNVGAVFR